MGKSKLTKADIVDLVFDDNEVQEYGVSRKEANIVISRFIDKLRESIEKLEDEDRIELRGFGTFGIKTRKARIARNPKTGDPVNVPERRIPYFKAGRDLKLAVLKTSKDFENQ